MSQGGDAGRAAVEWNGQVSSPSHHLFINASPEPLTLTWGPRLLLRPPPPPPTAGPVAGAAGEAAAGGEAGAAGGGAGDVETPHPEPVAPHGGVLFVGTYEFHTWRVRSASRGLICAHDGPPSVVEVTAAGDYIISPYTPERHQRAIAAAAAATAEDGAAAAGAAAAVAAAGAAAATASAVGATAAIPPAACEGLELSSLQQQQAGRQQQAGSAEEGQQGQQQQQAQQEQQQHVFVNLLPATPGAGQEGAGQEERAGQEEGAGRRRWLWLSWGDAEGRHDTPHPVPVPPVGGCVSVGASDAVTWRVRTAPPPQPGRLVASHSGPPSIVVIGAAGDDTDAAGTAAAVITVSVEPYSVARHTHWLYPHLRPHPLQPPAAAATAAAASHPSHIQAHTPAQQQQPGSMHPHPHPHPHPQQQQQQLPPPPPDSPLVPAAAAAPPLAGGASSPAYALGHVSSRHAATAGTGTRAAAATAAAATASAPAPLSAAASGATLHKDLHTVEWKGQVSASSYHLFVNDTREPLQLSWGDGAGHTEVPHGHIPPCGNLFVGTYEFHTWRVRSASRGLICAHTDVPAHRLMRYNAGRHLDTSARGLGATPAIPVTSCGEENLTMVKDRWYPCQSILVHEVGHAVHNLGLMAAQVAGVMAAYTSAMEAGRYPPDCYMASNEQEYWAVGVEAWFESSIRTDVSSAAVAAVAAAPPARPAVGSARWAVAAGSAAAVAAVAADPVAEPAAAATAAAVCRRCRCCGGGGGAEGQGEGQAAAQALGLGLGLGLGWGGVCGGRR
ncbi:hypothetical protein CHLRE_26g756997v5 [Chlamydomonas reinhardtii]|uniref:Uncharacterized protein n=1 Tax=Chlamydomonas reinhardtii TaxID=3055 RepID=A0A2K3CN24_CHLRE|nr:uncharacterized protein CHLRE_26g756997v5 [Chlamydomonas reinhardtii]PNW69673.1 hypothetical protein CHLRE_26g756997v5 [Chlamydomonas reinhardtii]